MVSLPHYSQRLSVVLHQTLAWWKQNAAEILETSGKQIFMQHSSKKKKEINQSRSLWIQATVAASEVAPNTPKLINPQIRSPLCGQPSSSPNWSLRLGFLSVFRWVSLNVIQVWSSELTLSEWNFVSDYTLPPKFRCLCTYLKIK